MSKWNKLIFELFPKKREGLAPPLFGRRKYRLEQHKIRKDLLDKWERPATPPRTPCESPGVYLENMVVAARYSPGGYYLCRASGIFFCRMFPYYWDRVGSRHWSFGPWEFKEYNKAEPPKNR